MKLEKKKRVSYSALNFILHWKKTDGIIHVDIKWVTKTCAGTKMTDYCNRAFWSLENLQVFNIEPSNLITI